jgi:hypothetical protein
MRHRQCHRISPGPVEKGGQRPQGGFGDLGVHGDLPGGLVPQYVQVERGEQAGLDVDGPAGQDVAGEGKLVEQGRVGGPRDRGGQGGELGLFVLLFAVQVGEPGGSVRAWPWLRRRWGLGGEQLRAVGPRMWSWKNRPTIWFREQLKVV